MKQNQYRLAYCVLDNTVKKLWRGDDWFSYVIGQEHRPVFNEGDFGLRSVLASFRCPYPLEFHAKSTAGVTPVPQATQFTGSPLTATVDTTAALAGTSGTNQYNHWHIYPNFIVTGGASTSVTQIVFKDERGCYLTFTPSDTLGSNEGWVIMPFSFRERPEGFNPRYSVAYKMASASAPATSEWLQDLDLYDSSDFTQSSNKPVSVKCPTSTDPTASGYRGKVNQDYPRFTAYDSSAAITATVTGTATDLAIYAQYLWGRIP